MVTTPKLPRRRDAGRRRTRGRVPAPAPGLGSTGHGPRRGRVAAATGRAAARPVQLLVAGAPARLRARRPAPLAEGRAGALVRQARARHPGAQHGRLDQRLLRRRGVARAGAAARRAGGRGRQAEGRGRHRRTAARRVDRPRRRRHLVEARATTSRTCPPTARPRSSSPASANAPTSAAHGPSWTGSRTTWSTPATGLAWDGLHVHPDGTVREIEKNFYTYCQGVLLGACVELAPARLPGEGGAGRIDGGRQAPGHQRRAARARRRRRRPVRRHPHPLPGAGRVAARPRRRRRAAETRVLLGEAVWSNRVAVVSGPLFGPEWTEPAVKGRGARNATCPSSSAGGWRWRPPPCWSATTSRRHAAEWQPHDRRCRSTGGSRIVSGGRSGSSMRDSSSRTAVRPISSTGCAIAVSGGSTSSAHSTSS